MNHEMGPLAPLKNKLVENSSYSRFSDWDSDDNSSVVARVSNMHSILEGILLYQVASATV